MQSPVRMRAETSIYLTIGAKFPTRSARLLTLTSLCLGLPVQKLKKYCRHQNLSNSATTKPKTKPRKPCNHQAFGASLIYSHSMLYLLT